jgi:hypothetical protein
MLDAVPAIDIEIDIDIILYIYLWFLPPDYAITVKSSPYFCLTSLSVIQHVSASLSQLVMDVKEHT